MFTIIGTVSASEDNKNLFMRKIVLENTLVACVFGYTILQNSFTCYIWTLCVRLQ